MSPGRPGRAPILSAGLLLFRRSERGIEVLLGHMGGPYWAARDAGAWSIPKGQVEPGEAPRDAALREFTEETGGRVDGELHDLGEVLQRRGKIVHAWAAEGDFDPRALVSTPCTIEWPPGSGQTLEVPEFDRVAWLTLDEARGRVLGGQAPLLDRLAALLAGTSTSGR